MALPLLLRGFFEWLLLTLLILHALAFHLLARAAAFFHLDRPCLLCARADRLDGPQLQHCTIREFLCDAHYASEHTLQHRHRWAGEPEHGKEGYLHAKALCGCTATVEEHGRFVVEHVEVRRPKHDDESVQEGGDSPYHREASIGSEICERGPQASPFVNADDERQDENTTAAVTFELTPIAGPPPSGVDQDIFRAQPRAVGHLISDLELERDEVCALRAELESVKAAARSALELQRKQLDFYKAKVFFYEAEGRNPMPKTDGKKSDDLEGGGAAPSAGNDNAVSSGDNFLDARGAAKQGSILMEELANVEEDATASENYQSLADFMPASAFSAVYGQQKDDDSRGIIFRRNLSFMETLGFPGEPSDRNDQEEDVIAQFRFDEDDQ